MSGPRSLRVVELSDQQRATLEALTRRTTVAVGLVRRARMVLLAADGMPLDRIAREVGADRTIVADVDRPLSSGRTRRLAGSSAAGEAADLFPLRSALHLVRRACELPEQAGRSLSQWDCAELARQLVLDEVVAAISPQTVQRMLAAHRLKPWRSARLAASPHPA